jgi:formylglycine-generating enzyme required for sulfatase activity
VVRGGSFLNDARFLRGAFRIYDLPGFRNVSFGFRVVWSRSAGLERA